MNRKLVRLWVLLAICAMLTPFVLAQISATQCTDNVRLLLNAVLSYAQDHDEILPPMKSEAEIEAALLPYVHSRFVFRCPVTHQFYQFNAALSRVTIAAIGDPGMTVVLQDSRPHPDGKSTIAYMDGYITYGGVDPTPETDCTNFAGRAALAAEMYAQDYDEVMPPMQNAAIFQQALLPYTHDTRNFNCPVTGLPYTPNAALSSLPLSAISDPATTVVLQDAQPHPDGKSTIAYLDGTVTLGGIDAHPDTDCVKFVRNLMGSIDAYASDHNGILPTMQNNAAFQSLLAPYSKDSRIFNCPATGLPYALNSALSGVDVATIPDEGTVIVVQDAKPHPDGKSTVGYMDGHILRGGMVQPNPAVACDESLRELLDATLQYALDNDEFLPPMKSYREFWSAIYPYVRSSWRFHCPATREFYAINHSLSGASLSSISDPAHTVLIRDAKPHPDRSMAIGYVAGFVVRRRL